MVFLIESHQKRFEDTTDLFWFTNACIASLTNLLYYYEKPNWSNAFDLLPLGSRFVSSGVLLFDLLACLYCGGVG